MENMNLSQKFYEFIELHYTSGSSFVGKYDSEHEIWCVTIKNLNSDKSYTYRDISYTQDKFQSYVLDMIHWDKIIKLKTRRRVEFEGLVISNEICS